MYRVLGSISCDIDPELRGQDQRSITVFSCKCVNIFLNHKTLQLYTLQVNRSNDVEGVEQYLVRP